MNGDSLALITQQAHRIPLEDEDTPEYETRKRRAAVRLIDDCRALGYREDEIAEFLRALGLDPYAEPIVALTKGQLATRAAKRRQEGAA